MRILYLTPQLPYPPRQGTQIRNYHLIKAAATAHQVDLLSFLRPGEGSYLGNTHGQTNVNVHAARNPLFDICRQVKVVPVPHRSRSSRLQTLFTSTEPDLARRLASRDFDATLRPLLEANSYDVVQVEGLEMASYITTVITTAPNTTVVFDDHNVEHLLQLRAAKVDSQLPRSWPKALYSAIQWLKLKRYERLACDSSRAVLAVSDADAKTLRGLGVTPPVVVVPNCIDAEHYRRGPDIGRDPATLLFTGTMDYRPNVDGVRWFASEVLPRILARRSNVRFLIVGRSPDISVLRLAQEHPAVQVVGAVEDIRPYFFQSTAFVVPIRVAGGARLKILEALAAELPVVATNMGVEGVDLADGRDALLADTPDAFVDAAIRLLDNQALRQKLGIAGRQFVEQKYDWKQVAPRLLAVYDAVGDVE